MTYISNLKEAMKNVKDAGKILWQIIIVQFAIVRKGLNMRREAMHLHQNAMVNFFIIF